MPNPHQLRQTEDSHHDCCFLDHLVSAESSQISDSTATHFVARTRLIVSGCGLVDQAWFSAGNIIRVWVDEQILWILPNSHQLRQTEDSHHGCCFLNHMRCSLDRNIPQLGYDPSELCMNRTCHQLRQTEDSHHDYILLLPGSPCLCRVFTSLRFHSYSFRSENKVNCFRFWSG
ncbi:hypothetical protein M758_12G099200 [Ceratodon purpureus]|nr:hypothetical protein M758_12G099200 [Ceratodon purpureus]